MRALGPAPRSDDGRFVNVIGPLEQAGPTVTLPFFARRVIGSFRSRPNAPERVPNDGVWLRENARTQPGEGRVPNVTWVGHATFLVQQADVTYLTDPIWSRTASPVSFAGPRRHVEPGLALDALPPIDFVVISHNHYDHLDLDSLAQLAEQNPDVHFYVPLANGELLRDEGLPNVVELDWGEARDHAGVRVTCLPSQHWSQRGIGDRMRALWSSWAVTSPDRRFYFAGDTGAFDGFARIGEAMAPFDLAAMPIGAYEPVAMMKPSHMNPEEAEEAARALGARRVVGMHFGTFDLTDEPLDEPPRRFRAAAKANGWSDEDVWVMKVGETRPF